MSAATGSARQKGEECLQDRGWTSIRVRPHGTGRVDRVKGGRLHNLKELRPASTGGTEVRILFVFDSARQMVLLVAGDKSGDWRRWYEVAIPLAEARYVERLRQSVRGSARRRVGAPAGPRDGLGRSGLLSAA